MKKSKFNVFMLFYTILFGLCCVGCNDNSTQGHTHEYTWETQTAATCTESEVESGTCACGDTITRVGDAALGHTEVIDQAVAPTCDSTGLTEGKHCGVCNEVILPQTVTSTIEHAWETEVTGNVITYTCCDCGESKTEISNVYTVASGTVEESASGVSSLSGSTIAVYGGKEFVEGTLSIDITLGKETGDNGIIFGLKNTTGSNYFWEGQGVTYYFFFISLAGNAYLGKTVNGQWIVCGIDTTSYYQLNKTYTLTVSRSKSNLSYDMINCYVDDRLCVSYKDETDLDGTGYGIRSALAGIKYSDFEISNEILGSNSSLDGYYTASGLFENQNGAIVSQTGSAILEVADSEFVYGKLEVTMKKNGIADDGIIFSLTSNESHLYWENNVSYYFFFVNIHGLACLGKVDNGTWTSCQNVSLNTYSPTGTYQLKVEKDATTIYGYVNGVCYITYSDLFPLQGTGYGLRAGGQGVGYTSLKCESSGEIQETYPNDLELITGKFTGVSGAAKAGLNNNLALIKDVNLEQGTLSANIKSVTSAKAGLVFGYSNANGVESYYRFVSNKNSQKVDVEKVINGVATNLYSNYLSAGYNNGVEYAYRVIIEDGKAYCYFWNTLYYVLEMELDGTRVGLYAEGAASQFRNYEVSADSSHITTDTLLFGHSYFELWSNYKSDLSSLAIQYDFGDYLDIGIGGSVASHWNNFKEGLVTYEADRVIYMIGINDLTAGTSPQMVIANIKETLLYMKNANPNLTVVLLSVNHCPARDTLRSVITETNVLMRNFVSQHNWISYGELEYAFCDNGVTPDTYWFTDGLHPTAAGYVQKIVPAIKQALDGVNQPELSPEHNEQLLANAKELKMCSLIDYSEWSYRSEEWAIAKPIYDEAVNAIESCQTIEEVEGLDLSNYISRLASITTNSDYAYEELRTSKHGSWWETLEFSNSFNSSYNGTYNIYHDGHRINNSVLYTDMSFKFSLTEVTGNLSVVGVIFRGQQTETLGIDGYFINYDVEKNYIQVWYFKNCFHADGEETMIYLGGWVFTGEVENTEFRAIVEGNMIYIYTEEDYQAYGKGAYGCSVDLTYNGQLTPYRYGGYGILNWSGANGRAKLSISNLSGNIVPSENATSTVVNGIISNQYNYSLNSQNIVHKENNTFNISGYGFNLYYGVSVSDFEVDITISSSSNVHIAGLLFRVSKNSVNDGIDGYLLNFVSNGNDQFIQVYYLSNCYNTNNTPVVCDYIGGWIYPGQVLETTFNVKVFGNYLFIETENHHLGVAVSLADAAHKEIVSGGFGLVSWADNFADLTINNLEVFG